MTAKTLPYKAVLIGDRSPKNHVVALQADRHFTVQIQEEKGALNIEVSGPLTETPACTFDEVLASCRKRADELGLSETRLGESTATQIIHAETAERKVLASRMKIRLTEEERFTRGELVIELQDEGPNEVRACFALFVRWRISCVAQAMGMQIEKNQIWN